jgi:cytochrome c-type biogenesis protein CcmE
MFREGIGVVVEGTVRKDGSFETNRLLVKHDNQYRAPGEGEEMEMEALMKSMQFDKSKKSTEGSEDG